MLAIPPITPAVAALAADLGVVLQPGAVLTAQVLKILDNNLVRIAIANLTLDVATTKPLQPGQTLQLEVAQSANGLSLTPVSPDVQTSARGAAVIVDDIPLAPRSPGQAAPTEPALAPHETQAVAVAAQTAVTKQAGLSPLFANLAVAIASGSLPQPVLVAAAQLLGLRLPSDKPLAGSDIRTALQTSGLTMEAALASPTIAAPPDIKSALLVLRQALATWSGQVRGNVEKSGIGQSDQEPGPGAVAASIAQPKTAIPVTQTATVLSEPSESIASQSVDARAVNTPPSSSLPSPNPAAATTPQAFKVSTDGGEPTAAIKSLLAVQLIASAVRPPVETKTQPMSSQPVPPPVRGTPPAPQTVASPTLAPGDTPPTIVRQLIADTDGALARQTLLQIASLPESVDPQTLRHDPVQQRWNFEIPFVMPQGAAMAQLEIARDGGGSDAETAQRVWRARFSLDIEPSGPVHALVAFNGDTTSVKIWAERPATAARLRADADQLGRSLDRAELKTGDIVVADGAPARAKLPSAGHFLNRAT